MKSLLAFLALILAASADEAPKLHAQNPSPDFDRVIAFAQQAEGKVFRASFAVHWLPDGQHCWCRVQTGPKTWEHVLVDAESGKLTRAADAASLGLPTTVLTTSKDTTTEARASEHTGEETRVRFTNGTAQSVELFWIDPQAKRKSYGKIVTAMLGVRVCKARASRDGDRAGAA